MDLGELSYEICIYSILSKTISWGNVRVKLPGFERDLISNTTRQFIRLIHTMYMLSALFVGHGQTAELRLDAAKGGV